MEAQDIFERLSGGSSGEKALHADILWTIAHYFLDSPRDVFNLARTCRANWELLETGIYRADVLFAKERIRAEIRRQKTFLEQEYDQVCSPESPDSPGVPHDAARQLLATGDEEELYAMRALSAPNWRPLTIMQWAAVTGTIATAEKVVKVAERIWPEYIIQRHLDSGNAAVHFAAWYGHTDVLRLISQARKEGHGIDMNAVSGETFDVPMDYGEDHGLAIRQVYLASQVLQDINPSIGSMSHDFTVRTSPSRPFNLTAAGIAILRGHEEAAKFLIDNFYKDNEIAAFDENGRLREDVDFKPSLHPLHLACFMGMYEVVVSILDQGADPNAKFLFVGSGTPLMWAAAAGPDNGKIIDYLLTHGADITIQDDWSRNAAVWALLSDAPKNAHRLISAGARVDVYFHTRDYQTSALGTCMGDDAFFDCTKLILQMHPDLPEALLKTSVQFALGHALYNEQTLMWIAEHGIGLEPMTEDDLGRDRPWDWREGEILGVSALHCVAGTKSLPLSLLSTIFEKRPQDINLALPKSGRTPLTLAIHESGIRSDKVSFLLAHGADMQSCENEGQRAVLHAIKEERTAPEVEDAIAVYEAQVRTAARSEESRKKYFDSIIRYRPTSDENMQKLWDREVNLRTIMDFDRCLVSVESFSNGTDYVLNLIGRGEEIQPELNRLTEEVREKKFTEQIMEEGLEWLEREIRRTEWIKKHVLGA